MKRSTSQKGFTAVELLITLFVAAAFLIAGYQLFNVIIKDGGDTRSEATASNIAYDYMRQYSASTANPCVASQPLTGSAVEVEGLANARISIVITCPQDDAPTVSKVEAFIVYGTSEETTIKFATFVDASKGAAPTSSLTTGLFGWWQFNGNATDSSGSGRNGTVTAATLTVGQNGASNTAYAFNGTSAYITVPSSIARPTTGMTISAWVKTADVQTSTTRRVVSTTQTTGYALSFSDTSCVSQLGFTAYIGGGFRSACTSVNPSLNDAWILATGVYDGSSVRIYLNGTLAASTGVSGSFSHSAGTVPFCIGSEVAATACTDGQYFPGSIDDVRAFSRALTPTEIQQLYLGGAQ